MAPFVNDPRRKRSHAVRQGNLQDLPYPAVIEVFRHLDLPTMLIMEDLNHTAAYRDAARYHYRRRVASLDLSAHSILELFSGGEGVTNEPIRLLHLLLKRCGNYMEMLHIDLAHPFADVADDAEADSQCDLICTMVAEHCPNLQHLVIYGPHRIHNPNLVRLFLPPLNFLLNPHMSRNSNRVLRLPIMLRCPNQKPPAILPRVRQPVHPASLAVSIFNHLENRLGRPPQHTDKIYMVAEMARGTLTLTRSFRQDIANQQTLSVNLGDVQLLIRFRFDPTQLLFIRKVRVVELDNNPAGHQLVPAGQDACHLNSYQQLLLELFRIVNGD